MSAQALFALGQNKARSKLCEVKKGKASVSTTSPTSKSSSDSKKRSHGDAFAMPASAVPIKTATSNGSAATSTLPSPATKSLKIQAAALTGNGPVSSPFWTPSVAALSQRLWLPTATASRASAWNSWNGCSSATIQGSWFSAALRTNPQRPTSCETTYSQSLLSSWLATTEGGLPQIASDAATPPPSKKAKKEKKNNPDKPSAAKARKIRVYPNPRQRELLQKWFGTARWTYNQCLALIQKDRSKLSKKELRATLINNENFAVKDMWVTEVPYEVRDGAMVDLINAYTSNFAKKRKNPEHQFSLRFRSKKAPQEAIMIRGKCFKKAIFYPKFFGKEPLRSSEPLPDLVDYDCKLLHNRLGHYYLCLPMPLEMASDNQARLEDRVIALDPGVRTFHTGYDPSGSVIEFGKGDIGHIYRICAHMDALQSKIDSNKELKHKARYRMRRAWRKMQWRVRNLVDECHKKIVKFLCSNYSVVLLPSFETQHMVVRNQRKINSKAARAMITWSHYRFKQRLLFKRQEHPWCKVVVCNEAYTSKTCGHCGQLHHALGGSKVFNCPACGTTLDRDANAARNILLKNASLFGFTPQEDVGSYPLSAPS